MVKKFASEKNPIAACDRCGFRYKLKLLKNESRKGQIWNIRVCPTCWDMDHPQWFLGTFPVEDAQAIENPRPDTDYFTSGYTTTDSPGGGSRIVQWGWSPIGGAASNDIGLTPNALATTTAVGQVTIQIS